MYYLPVREILSRLLSSQRKCTEVDCETRRSWKEQKSHKCLFFRQQLLDQMENTGYYCCAAR